MLDRLFEFLRAIFTIKRRPVEIDELFKHIDLAAIAADIEVDSKGEEEGKANVPPENATKLGGFEGVIANYFVQEAQATAIKAQSKIVGYRSQMQKLDISDEKGKLQSIVPSLTRSLKRLLADCGDDLPHSRAAMLNCRVRLKRFKDDNGIDRPAREIVRRKNLGFLFVLIILESVLNSYFFMLGSQLGLLGGWLEALLASLFNNAIGFLIGWLLLRNIFHCSVFRKLVGWGSLLLFAILAPIVNFAIAHYREALAAVPDTAQSEAMQAVGEMFVSMSPGIDRLDSWVLWVFGIFFAVLALIDGLLMDDDYPGYGSLDRELHGFETEYFEGRDEVIESIMNEAARAENDSDSIITKLIEKREEFRMMSGMSETIENRCAGYHRVLEQSCDALLNRYRGKNLARRTEPPPPHFNRQYQFTRLLLELPETIRQEDVAERVSEISRLLKIAGDVKKEAKDIYTEYRNDIDNMIANVEHGQSK